MKRSREKSYFSNRNMGKWTKRQPLAAAPAAIKAIQAKIDQIKKEMETP